MCDSSRFILLLTLVLSLMAPLIQAKSALPQSAPKSFNAEDAFSVQSTRLQNLMLDFYECQPQSLLRNTKVSKEEFVQWVFEGPFNWKFDAIRNRQSVAALRLSFNTEYQGDRVLPLITGLYTMLLKAYGGKNEYTFITPVNPHQLMIAAHNVELGVVKLHKIEQESVGLYQSESCSAKIFNHFDEISQQLQDDYKTLTNERMISEEVMTSGTDNANNDFMPIELL